MSTATSETSEFRRGIETACRAVCWMCKRGEALKTRRSPFSSGLLFVHPEGDLWLLCRASDIRCAAVASCCRCADLDEDLRPCEPCYQRMSLVAQQGV